MAEVVQFSQILREEFELIKAELIAKHEQLGMKASGDWERSLNVQQQGLGVKLLGAKYSEQLEYGRRAGKQPPSEAIERWINEKGLASRLQGKITVKSLAYLIARKIAREGWRREQFGGVELISQVVTPERIQKILDRIEQTYIPIISKEIQLMYAE